MRYLFSFLNKTIRRRCDIDLHYMLRGQRQRRDNIYRKGVIGFFKGAAHCNINCYGALHLLFIIHSQSTNIRVRCTCFHEVIPFDIRFKKLKNLENNYFRLYLTFSSVVRQLTDHRVNNF